MGTFGVGLRLRVARLAGAVPAGAIALAELGGVAVATEAAGFDALYLAGVDPSRVTGTRDGAGTVWADPFVALGAVAPVTSRLALGCLATPLGERPPSLLAKVVASLDVCSAGRAVAALGPALPRPSGSTAPEGAGVVRAGRGRSRAGGAHGEGDAIGRLGEAVEICRAMLRLPAPSMEGAYYRIEQAWNEPKAERPEPTPVGLLIPGDDDGPTSAEDGEFAGLLGLAARFADVCFLGPRLATADGLAPIAEAFRAACRQAGRLPGSVALGAPPRRRRPRRRGRARRAAARAAAPTERTASCSTGTGVHRPAPCSTRSRRRSGPPRWSIPGRRVRHRARSPRRALVVPSAARALVGEPPGRPRRAVRHAPISQLTRSRRFRGLLDRSEGRRDAGVRSRNAVVDLGLGVCPVTLVEQGDAVGEELP